MNTKIFKLGIILSACFVLAANAEDKIGFHYRLTWVGDADVELIWRNPQNPDLNSIYEPLDCYYGQKNPDWGVIGQEFDNPSWSEIKAGDTNIQEVISEALLDVGSYGIIARIINGEAECHLDRIREEDKDINERQTMTLNADDFNTANDYMILTYDTQKELLYSKVLKFKQKKANNKYLFKINYTAIPDELTTNDIARLFLNSELAYSDNNWESNKKQTKFYIDKPWTIKIIKKTGKQFIYVRGIAENFYKDANVESSLLIGNYIGTNSFLTDKHAKYKYKQPKD